jgi:hypothetical protein
MRLTVGFLALTLATAIAWAQDQSQLPAPGWHRFDEPRPANAPPPPPDPSTPPAPAPATTDPNATPPVLTLPAGTWITVRLDQPLSSDHNQPGDAFTGTLVHPLVVNGLVVAHRGQTIGGRVAAAQKAGRIKGTSKLALEITEIRFADGQQLPVHTQWIQRNGDTSVGRDAAAIGATTGAGAGIGALAAGGMGAGIGAAAGAVASTIGVLVTRGKPAVVHPEQVLTFRLTAPVEIDTTHSHNAFRPVQQSDYSQPRPRRPIRAQSPPPTLYAAPPPVMVGVGFGWGPWFGPRWGWPGWYW